MPSPRSTTPIITKIRNFLLGRRTNSVVRFEMDQAPRTPPPARLPPGPFDRLCFNYYQDRDARREIRPPEVVYSVSGKKVLTNDKVKRDGKHKTPGEFFVPQKNPVS